MTTSLFTLIRNDHGRLVFSSAGETIEAVVPVRAFPVSQPDEGIAIVAPDGRELLWLDELTGLDAETRRLIEETLAARDFMPEIRRIDRVSTFATPSTWTVETDRGLCDFILVGEEDIRRLPGGGLLVADRHGIQFLIRDLRSLDRTSRRLLDRFL